MVTEQDSSIQPALQLYAVAPEGPRPLPAPPDATDLHDLLRDLPAGVYTAFRTFDHNKFLFLEDHLKRLDRSMSCLGWDFRLDRRAVRRALHEVCTAYPLADARVRLDVLDETGKWNGDGRRVLIGLSPFVPVPAEVHRRGVQVGLTRVLVRPEPQIKRAAFARQRRLHLGDLYEILLVGGADRLLEGASSNFFAVLDGQLWTAGSGVLEGVARKITLQIAREMKLPVRLEPVTVAAIPELQEAAMSSSSRGIIPVVRIGEQMVGDGLPGPIVTKLVAAYNAFVPAAARPAI